MVIFLGFDDLLLMHIYHVLCGDAYRDVEMVHAVLHIVWAHVTRDASAKARAYSRRHALF